MDYQWGYCLDLKQGSNFSVNLYICMGFGNFHRFSSLLHYYNVRKVLEYLGGSCSFSVRILLSDPPRLAQFFEGFTAMLAATYWSN